MNESAQFPGGEPIPESRDTAARPGPSFKEVTLGSVARAVGLSQGAVSSVLNDRDYGIRANPKTRDAVFRACRRLGYIPNDLRALVRIYPEKGDTCLLVSTSVRKGLANPFVARLAAAIMACPSSEPASISVMLADDAGTTGPDCGFPTPIRNGTASRLLCVGMGDGTVRRIVRERRIPGVFIGHASTAPGTASIVPDYARALRLAFELLIDRGHRRIGILAGPSINAEPRLNGIQAEIPRAIAGMGMPFDSCTMLPGDLDFESGVIAMNSLLGHADRPTALLALADTAAIGALAAAHHHGIRIPDDMSVITFSDHAGMLDSCIPLTSIVVPVETIAAAAMAEADRQLRKGIPAGVARISVPVRLIERATCGRAPVAGRSPAGAGCCTPGAPAQAVASEL